MIRSVGLGSPGAGRFSMENEDTRSFRPPARVPAKRRVLDTSLPVIRPVRALGERAVVSPPKALRAARFFFINLVRARPSSRVFQTEGLAIVVVGEHLRVAAPADDGAQRLLGSILGHVVLKLVEEAALGR